MQQSVTAYQLSDRYIVFHAGLFLDGTSQVTWKSEIPILDIVILSFQT